MKEKNRTLTISAISGTIGGILGVMSGSNNLIVIAIVSAFFAIISSWIISKMIR